MTKYVIKRVLLMFLTLFLIMTICFVLIKLLPLPAIRPISDLRTDLNGVCEDACESQQPIFMKRWATINPSWCNTTSF